MKLKNNLDGYRVAICYTDIERIAAKSMFLNQQLSR